MMHRIFIVDGPVWTSAGMTAGLVLSKSSSLQWRLSDFRQGSADFDEVLVRQRSAGELHELSTEGEWAKVYASKSKAVYQSSNLHLRTVVIARVKQHPAAAVSSRVARQHLRSEMVECLHEARAAHQACHDLA
jgi:transcriptional regulator GlxA family with amidase domain